MSDMNLKLVSPEVGSADPFVGNNDDDDLDNLFFQGMYCYSTDSITQTRCSLNYLTNSDSYDSSDSLRGVFDSSDYDVISLSSSDDEFEAFTESVDEVMSEIESLPSDEENFPSNENLKRAVKQTVCGLGRSVVQAGNVIDVARKQRDSLRSTYLLMAGIFLFIILLFILAALLTLLLSSLNPNVMIK